MIIKLSEIVKYLDSDRACDEGCTNFKSSFVSDVICSKINVKENFKIILNHFKTIFV